MAERGTAKQRLLYLLDILEQKTDDEHPLSTEELIGQLQAYDITAERKAIYRDIEALQAYGADIIHTRTPKSGYFLGERRFQLAEIRLLMDAVLSAGFITQKKSAQLIKKLTGMVSGYQAEELNRQIYIDRRQKHKNEEIYYTIDEINRAVAQRKKISFEYRRRVLGENGAIAWSMRNFTISPYAMLWFDDRYYVIGNHEKYDNLMHLRADRMHRVKMLPQSCRPFEEVSEYRGSFDVADYAKKLSNAFTGPAMVVELVCEAGLLEAVLDRFGDDLSIRRRPDGKFSFRVEMAISDGLTRDLLNFGAGVEVVSPRILREKLKQTIAALQAVYQDCD